MRFDLRQLGWRVLCAVLISWMSVQFSNGAWAAEATRTDVSRKASPVHDSNHPPAGISQGAWGKIMAQIREDQYRISRDVSAPYDNSIYRAVNPANGLRVSFDQQGVEMKPLSENKDWDLKLSLAAYGFEGSLKSVLPTEPKEVSTGLEYDHKGIRQWYQNDSRGLEQGFTIEKEQEEGGTGRLMLVLNTSGSLTPKALISGGGIGFYDEAGRMAVSYGDLKVVDAGGKRLPSTLRLVQAATSETAGEILISVDTTNARYPITIDPLFSGGEIKLTASDASAYDNFGTSVAISGDTVVVGAWGNDDAGFESGSAYIFCRNQGGADNWGQVRKLTASDAATGDWFGYSVSISGDTVVVGAYGNDDAGSSSGSAYVFSRNKGGADNWGQVRKLVASDAAENDWFGYSVSISGDTVVVGAWGNDDAGNWTGSAYVFSRNKGGADNWGQVRKLVASDASAYDKFGNSVAISGNTVVVGAIGNSDAGENSGSAYIFFRNQGGADNWGQVRKLTASDAAIYDLFGRSVSISGDTVVVGADGNDDAGENSGSAYIFCRNQGGADNWGQVRKLVASDAAENDWFGYSVSISGDTVVAGANYDDDAGSSSGSAYIFCRNQGGADNWGQVRKLTASDASAYDHFGISVAISGDTVVAGAYNDDDAGSNSGSAYLYPLSHGEWTQKKRQCTAPTTGFGSSLAINRDVLAVGAPDYGTNGAVYLFYRNTAGGPDTWEEKLKINGYMSGEQFGFSVALGKDKLVVGAPYYTNGGKDGAAYVFYRNLGGPDSWGKIRTITAASDGGGLFGWSVSLSGDKVAIGAPYNYLFTGSAYLFYRNQGGQDMWGEVKRVTALDPNLLDQFGYTVSLDGDILAVGAPFHDYQKGAVYIFYRNTGFIPNNVDNWGQVQKQMADDAETEDHFGYGLSLNNDQLVVGAPDEDSQGKDAGAVYVFYRNYGSVYENWGQVKKILVNGGAAGDQFGWSVKHENDMALVGAVGCGCAYVLERNEGGSDQWGNIRKFTPGDSATSFGRALAMDEDLMAVGAESASYLFQRALLGPMYVDPEGLCNGNTPCYSTIQAAVDASDSGFIIKIRQGTYPESITLNENKSLTLQGNWDPLFQNQTGTTILRNAPRAPKGRLTLQELNIKPQ